MELNIYWHLGCCETLRPIDEFDPGYNGKTLNNDNERFGGEWVKMHSFRSFDKPCPECDAPEPLIFGRKFIIE